MGSLSRTSRKLGCRASQKAPRLVSRGKNNYPRCLFTTLDVFRRGFIIFVLGFIVLICFLCCFFGEGEVWKDIHEEELDP